jgi:hypothetical protein
VSDLSVNNLNINFVPRPGGDPPAVPVVYSVDAKITNDGLTKAVKLVLEMAADKAPVEVEFQDAHFVDGGAEITVSAGVNRFLKASATAEVGISARGENRIAVDINNIQALGKLPVEGIIAPILEKALAKAAAMPGIERDPSNQRGLLINPNVLLQAKGIPLEFKEPGAWSIVYGPTSMTAKYLAS